MSGYCLGQRSLARVTSPLRETERPPFGAEQLDTSVDSFRQGKPVARFAHDVGSASPGVTLPY